MTLKHGPVAFGVLTAALAISALYELYRATVVREVPEFDVFNPLAGLFYVACVGVSALILTDERWAWWVVSILVLALFSLGPFTTIR